MHSESIEAHVHTALSEHLGDPDTLKNIRDVLRNSNLRVLREGQSEENTRSANLMESLFISHGNLAKALGDAVAAMQHLQARLEQAESAFPPMQEAILNLQLRVRDLEAATKA